MLHVMLFEIMVYVAELTMIDNGQKEIHVVEGNAQCRLTLWNKHVRSYLEKKLILRLDYSMAFWHAKQ